MLSLCAAEAAICSPMKILFASSELTPFVRTGGLGDVLEALPSALAQRGHDVSVVLPCYRGLQEDPRLAIRSTGVQLTVQVGAKRLDAEILVGEAPNGVQIFLIRRDEYFDRSAIYGADGRDYGDNAERFIFFSKAVVELARRVVPSPEILHVHDWQTALVPVLAKEWGLPLKTVLTIHNLAYQGSFWGLDFGLTNLPGSYFTEEGVEFYGNLNLLKGGILHADELTTVSERYAREMQSPEFGCALEYVVKQRASQLTGILNGADSPDWDPARDPFLNDHFSAAAPEGKALCRAALLAALGLAPSPRGPVFAMVSRLAEQKGIDLLLPILDRLLADDVRLIILGEGDTGYERELLIASKRHPKNFAFLKTADLGLAHRIEAGADVSLIPSHFEPAGLTAMYSQKYGAIPIARATGGLHQIIQDYEPSRESGTGFLFFDYQPEALLDSITRAKLLFQDKSAWKRLMQRAMALDFSWAKTAQSYEAVYERALSLKSITSV